MIITSKHTSDYIKELRSNGRYAFTEDDLYESVHKDKKNVRKDLDRLVAKGQIKSIRRGFYTIIPEEYRNMGELPVDFYIDDLMKFIEKKYYVGLYSAAMLHGAAHQQPQEYYVVSATPKPRKIKKGKLIINFSEKKNFPELGIEEKKTSTGYLKLSSKELTFFDLIYYAKNIGGINRIITILDELREEIKVGKFKEAIKNDIPNTVLQRAGYILDQVFYQYELSNIIEQKLVKANTRVTKLNPAGINEGFIDEKWKVKVNTNIESDL